MENVARERAYEAWRWLLRCPSFGGNVFEGEPSGRTFCCGAAVFVEPDFVRDEMANPRPGINGRIVSSVVERAPVVLDYERLREVNTHGELDLVVLIGAFAEDLHEQEIWEANIVMSAVFVNHYAGYNIARILYEAIGPLEVAIHTATSVSRTIRMFDAQRGLMCITPESAASMTGSQISRVFLKRHPVLRLGQAEQDMLLAALDELTDDELSSKLNAHVGTIKKRWTRIFERFVAVLPGLVSDGHFSNDDHQRGKQKRHRVLAYVREHPEELRPYDYEAEPLSIESAEIG